MRDGVTLLGRTTVCAGGSAKSFREHRETYPALDVPGDDGLRGRDAELLRDGLHLGDVQCLLDLVVAAEGRVCFEEEAVLLRPLRAAMSTCYGVGKGRRTLRSSGCGFQKFNSTWLTAGLYFKGFAVRFLTLIHP